RLLLPSFPTRRSSDLELHRDGDQPEGDRTLPDAAHGHSSPDSRRLDQIAHTRHGATNAISRGTTCGGLDPIPPGRWRTDAMPPRSEEHTSELQSRENL